VYLEADVRVETCDTAHAIRAAGLALREFPRLNGAYRDGVFETYSRVNVGFVLTGGEAPVIPTIFDADGKDAGAIREEIERLAESAGGGGLTSPQLAGGTFTVMTAGAGAIRSIAAILNQGQAGLLALGPVSERALAREGTVVAGRALTATLSCDARIVDVEEATRFLDRFRELLEGD
jgi:pyruvate dehydrogenase E2 component (dihydrolipoamide acetyltransferase)